MALANDNELDSRSVDKIEIMSREYRVLDQKSVLNPDSELMPVQEYIKFYNLVTALEKAIIEIQKPNITEEKKAELKNKIDKMVKLMIVKEALWGKYNAYKDTVRELNLELDDVENMLSENNISNS